jgi:hypothetical protein
MAAVSADIIGFPQSVAVESAYEIVSRAPYYPTCRFCASSCIPGRVDIVGSVGCTRQAAKCCSVYAGKIEQAALYQQQIAAYLKTPSLPHSTDIFGHWRCIQFSSLEPAAQRYLPAAKNSVASVQFFTSARQHSC